MKYVKVIGIVVIALAVIVVGFWQIWGKGIAEGAQIGANFGAKHVCSCVYVAERPMESCQSDFVGDDFKDFEFENADGVVTAKAPLGLGKADAKFEPGLGCKLFQP